MEKNDHNTEQAAILLQALDLKAFAEWGKENGGYTLSYLRSIEQKAKNGTLPETTASKVTNMIHSYLHELTKPKSEIENGKQN